ncbi:unnamed protein product [Urochloa decumbens]|uniref:Receptor-like serine/threonine-protein kinase n=1 Tax=Urochloa decumbens TaxID=240449 RepID=A0ABC8ZZR4_9POAL
MLNAALLAAVVLHGAIFTQSQELNDTLTTEESLLNGQTLVSAQKTFVLGFFSNGDSTYLGIWYNYMKPQTIVWVANRENPIKGGNGTLTLTANSLDLLDRRGITVWSSGTLNTNSPQAFLLDTGNLVVNDTVSGVLLWQGFDLPCDSLLPSLRIGYDTSTNHEWYLTSWKSYSDPSPGDYYLKLDPNRLPDVLLFQGAQLKYRMGTWNGQGFSGVPALKANNQLAFNMTASEGSAYYSFTALDRSILWRFVISPDGFAHRWHSNLSNEWVEYWHLPQDQCDYYAYCGQNAACYNGDCKCLQEFVPKSPNDWSQRNFNGGCVRNVVLSCSSHNGFAHMSHVKVPDTLNATMVRGKSWNDCSKLCLGNCSCGAYTVFGDDDCVIWSGDLVDIVQLAEGINDLYTRVSHSDSSHRDRNIAIVVSVSVVGMVLVISALLGFCYRRREQKHLPLAHEHEHVPGRKLTAPVEKNLDLDAIRVATNNFSEQNVIVSSRSRTIYKGTLQNFGELVAKRLNTETRLEELKTEVEFLARLDHPNIIRMLGSWIGNNDKMIILAALNLRRADEDERSGVPDWPSRFRIIQGICEGLFYLHEHFRIVHRDIDPSNILLGEGFIPKISDFGLATLLNQGESEGKAENFRGTPGYSAPELLYGKYSVKSDVYSFGVVLLEIVTGYKAASFCREDTDDLPRYVRQQWTQGTADQLKDQRMGDAPRGEVERCIHIGVRCVQDDPTVRPTMSYVRNTLAAIRP